MKVAAEETGTVEVKVLIENAYANGDLVVVVEEVEVPAPPSVGEEREEWALEHLFPLTGTGASDEAGYFVTITESSEPHLIGATFEWGI